ncbi:uncharacterized protein LOC111452434 isoform X2 [Cucurbita moschata]|uniref:Uncharacterized protein LOC111452434 isoform X2 n=1 Tax=Cucurbita moschata TaxID=3662 RepID=A0A6J1GAN8_CUCMO|nr:uncharacterized protein LOC111452434 isoform X2 [Cucurbita moschata]
MVSGLRIEGGTQILPARVRKTIQSIKEIVGDHSDADIYTTLKETNMDPNETAQKLLNQDPFREVKRRRDKKKENMGYKGSLDAQRHSEDVRQGTKVYTLSDRNVRRGAYAKSSWPGISKEFRVVRDNRVNRNTHREVKPALPHLAISTNELSTTVSKTGINPKGEQGPSGGRISQVSFRKTDSHPNNQRDGYSTEMFQKELRDDVGVSMLSSIPDTNLVKPNDSEQRSAVLASNGAAVGLYSSSTDPVHVPSPDSRSSAAVGAIKREVGVVGVRRQLKDISIDQSSGPSLSLTNSVTGRDCSSTDSFQPLGSTSKGEHLSQMNESVIPGLAGSRSTLNNQHSSRQHQPTMGHQKASQHNKEWKPKSSQKLSTSNPGVIGTPSKSKSPTDESRELPSEAATVQDKLARVDLHENQNVIIAEHIRVPDNDQYGLVFGSFGAEFDSSTGLLSGLQAVRGPEELSVESSSSQSISAPEISTDDASGSRQVNLLDDQVRSSESNSPDSGTATELQSADKRESSSSQALNTYAEIGIVRERSPKYVPTSQHQDPSELPGFSAYDPQTGYDIPYFRPTVDETVRVQGLPSQEAVNSHATSSIPTSTIPMVQQQQTPVAQMYPQVHVSHFANLMPYRQFLSPVFVPPLAMPGYSSSPAYPHPSNGNSYLVMPGGSTHMNANNLKYGIQPFKTIPAGSPAGFGNFNNPAGFAMNAPGVVGSANGLEDSSRIKYKDGNLYVPNAQAETSEIWIQNPRDLPGLQSASYYSMPGQTPHGAYLPSHTGHASFGAQSTHMQFPGLYHPPPQPAPIGNPHHMGPGMGGNVGVAGATPGPQVGAFQQPQLGHLNWTTNF